MREFASTAGSVIEAMNGLYDAWLAAPEAAQGKLPVVRCAGVLPVTGKHGVELCAGVGGSWPGSIAPPSWVR